MAENQKYVVMDHVLDTEKICNSLRILDKYCYNVIITVPDSYHQNKSAQITHGYIRKYVFLSLLVRLWVE